MSGAYNHKVRPLTEDEVLSQQDRGRRKFTFLTNNPYPGIKVKNRDFYVTMERKCRLSRHCPHPSSYMLSYLYVTGQRGNVSMMEKPVCTVHAAKYFTDEQAAEQARILISEANGNA